MVNIQTDLARLGASKRRWTLMTSRDTRPVTTGSLRGQCLPKFIVLLQVLFCQQKFVLNFPKKRIWIPLSLETWPRACVTL